MSSERVFIIGGTGNIGKKCVSDLLKKQIPVTLYSRNPEKVKGLFESDLVQIVQGDFQDLESLKTAIKGHSRLFLLITDFSQFASLKEKIARYGYEGGVRQVVDISSFTVNSGWRSMALGAAHYAGEKAIFDIEGRGSFVALRPGRFMSNHFHSPSPLKTHAIYDTRDPDEKQGWISPNDIGAVAAVVLSEPVEKHGDAVYNLTGDVLTGTERAEAFSRVFGEKIEYRLMSAKAKYELLLNTGIYPHLFALDLVDNLNDDPDARITLSIELLLNRKPQTFEEYMSENKSLFH